MDAITSWPWLGLLLLGALHGVNPGMGWLFAVSLGLQRGDSRSVWGALAPLAAGHLLAIAAVLALAAAAGLVVPPDLLRWGVGAALAGMGGLQLVRHWHPRRGGMRVGSRDLTIWSFLMASAHGAGLMALPLVMAADAQRGAGGHEGHLAAGRGLSGELLLAGAPGPEVTALLATLVHTAGYLLVTGIVAVIVYEKLGLRMLRTAWINLDLIWGVALLVTGALTVVL